ncbi:MAG: hypothetical protein F6K11_03660 [Leptolyngbya sp. SIO3F4]|nr:hypothetical protein [Leptolyngbya sp. SIO3F4]
MLKPRSAFSLAATVALLAVVAPSQPFSSFSAIAVPAVFEVPVSVPSNTKLKVSSGSDAMVLISEALKADFEDQFSGAQVNVDAVSADQAIKALVNGESDLAAISRPLSADEEAQGLIAVDVDRPKIAIIVGEGNPFSDSLTSEQFAKIFRGEITNWSEVGGSSGAIRLVDRPATSDTRLALAPYPVFQAAEFVTGSSATQVNVDSTEGIVKELGTDGISYGLIAEVENLAGIRIVPMHKTLPTDSRYPFSQPFSFVYKGAVSPAVAAFLGYATGEPGQTTLKSANPLAGVLDAAGNTVKGTTDAAGNAFKGSADIAGNAVEGAADVTGNVVKGATDAAGNVVEGATDAAGNAVKGAAEAAGNLVESATGATGNVVEGAADVAGDVANQVAVAAEQGVRDRNPESISRANLWWLLLIPAACLGLVAWGARRKDQSTTYAVADGPNVELSGIGKAGASVVGGAAATGSVAWSTAKQGGSAVKSGLDNVGNATQRGFSNVRDGVDNVGGIAKGSFDNVGGAAKSGLGGLQSDVGNVGKTVKSGLGDASNAAKSGLGSIQSGIGNVGDAAKGDLGNIKGSAQQGFQGMKGDLENAGHAVQGGLDNVGDGVKGGLGHAGSAIQEGTHAVAGKLNGMTDDTGNVVKNVANDAAKGSQSLWQRVRNSVSQVGDQAVNLKDKASDITDDLKDLGK